MPGRPAVARSHRCGGKECQKCRTSPGAPAIPRTGDQGMLAEGVLPTGFGWGGVGVNMFNWNPKSPSLFTLLSPPFAWRMKIKRGFMRSKSNRAGKRENPAWIHMYGKHQENLSVHPGGEASPPHPAPVATPPVVLIRYILLIFPAVFTAAYNPASSLISSRSSRTRLEPVRFLRMARWKGGITSPRWTPSSSPSPGPRAGFYYQAIDKPGVRWAGTCHGAGRALLQPPRPIAW